jgi:hypothetical protein
MEEKEMNKIKTEQEKIIYMVKSMILQTLTTKMKQKLYS